MTSSPRSSTEGRGERSVVFEGGVITLPPSLWNEGAGWVLNLHRLADLGAPLSLPPDPNPMPRFHLFGAPHRQGRKHG